MNRNAIEALRRASAEKHQARLAKELILRKSGIEEVGKMSRRDLFMVGLALYWGEGYKGRSQEFGFTNSDPAMVLFLIRWLKEIYRIPNDDLILRISINETHLDRKDKVERYWSRITGIPLRQFTMTSFIKASHKRSYTNHQEHYGTLRVKVRRGTDLRRKVLGSIEQFKTFGTLKT